MSDGYFDRLIKTTSSRVWVNNPTLEEVGLALQQGAVGCTTNPTLGLFCGQLVVFDLSNGRGNDGPDLCRRPPEQVPAVAGTRQKQPESQGGVWSIDLASHLANGVDIRARGPTSCPV